MPDITRIYNIKTGECIYKGKGTVAEILGAGVLAGVSFDYADLGCKDLRGAYMNGAKLNNASLRGAKMTGADLNGADLSGAFMSDADLSYADLRGANFYRAQLSRADLSRAYIFQTNFNHANLAGANLSDTILSKSPMFAVDLRDAKLPKGLPFVLNMHQRLYNMVLQADLYNMVLQADLFCLNLGEMLMGHLVSLAKKEGISLIDVHGLNAAAALIWTKSDRLGEPVPIWNLDIKEMLTDMKRRAEMEAALDKKHDASETINRPTEEIITKVDKAMPNVHQNQHATHTTAMIRLLDELQDGTEVKQLYTALLEIYFAWQCHDHGHEVAAIKRALVHLGKGVVPWHPVACLYERAIELYSIRLKILANQVTGEF